MRVLMVISQFYPIVGGAERQAQKLAKALLKRGVQVTVLTGGYRGMGRELSEVEGIPVYRHFARGIPLPKGEFGQGYGYMLGLALALYRFRDSYDLIHVHQMLYSAWTAGVVGNWMNKPVIAKVGNTGERFDLYQLEQSPRIIGRWMARSMKEKITRAIAICSKSINELQRAGFSRDQITLIPNGVDVPNEVEAFDRDAFRHDLGVDRDTPIIVFVGRLLPKKDISTLLAALKRLTESVCATPTLLLVGDGKLRPLLEAQAQSLGITHLVRFIGQVQDVGPYLRASDVFVLSSRAEGLSNALLEAMVHRLPCIATTVGGNTDVIEDGVNGLLVPAGDVVGLATSLKRLIENPDLRTRLAVAGWETVGARFSIEHIADQYLKLYREILTSTSTRKGII